MKTTMARFPFHKTLESFDFKFQPSIDVKTIKEIITGRFIANADNVLLLGTPEVGKTHLAVGIGLKACSLRHRTGFTTAAGLIGSLVRTRQESSKWAQQLQVETGETVEIAFVDQGYTWWECRRYGHRVQDQT